MEATDQCVSIACSTNSDPKCNDGNACTNDVCLNPGTASASCSHTAISYDDGNDCTYDSCDIAVGPVHTNAPDGTACPGGKCDGQGVCKPDDDGDGDGGGGCGCMVAGTGGNLEVISYNFGLYALPLVFAIYLMRRRLKK